MCALLLAGLLFSSSVGVFARKTPLTHMLQSTIAKTDINTRHAEEVLKKIEDIHWKEMAEDLQPLTLKQALLSTAEYNLQVQLKSDSPREKDLALQKALLDADQLYVELATRWMESYLRFQSIRQAKKDLLAAERQFETGETTGIEVLKVETDLITRYRQFKAAQVAYMATSQALALHAGLKATDLYFPQDLSFANNRFLVDLPNVIPDELTDKQAKVLALVYRPDLKQLESERDELKIKFLGITSMTPLGSARLKDLDILIKQLKTSIEATTATAYDGLLLSEQNVNTAQASMQLAEKALYQTQISKEAGFSSEKDLLDVEVLFAQAQVAYVQAMMDAHVTQFKLLWAMGRLTTPIATGESPLVLEKPKF